MTGAGRDAPAERTGPRTGQDGPNPAPDRLQPRAWTGALPPGTAAPSLWTVDLATPLSPAEWACLNDAERQRFNRQVFPAGRRRLAAARAALRSVLGTVIGVAPASIVFDQGPQGKPALPFGQGPFFNLSHSGDHAWILVAPAGHHGEWSVDEWGIDIELLRPVDDREAVAERVFTPRERAALARARPDHRDRDFLRLWTRKEACLKAIGSGLALEPDRFEVGLDAGPVAVELPWPDPEQPRRVWCLPLDEVALGAGAPQGGVVAAAAVYPPPGRADVPSPTLGATSAGGHRPPRAPPAARR